MVLLHIKKNDESQFLFETSINTTVEECYCSIITIYNGRLKIMRICDEMVRLEEQCCSNPQQNTTDSDNKQPVKQNSDETSASNFQLTKDVRHALSKAVEEGRAVISENQVKAGVVLTYRMVQDTVDMLRSVMCTLSLDNVNCPAYDEIKRELDNSEVLPVDTNLKEVMDPNLTQLWFASKLLERGKKLGDYVGKNEKTKVILKINKAGCGPPPREPLMSEEERKLTMLHAFRRQEDLKKLEKDDDDSYLNSCWADGTALKKSFQGISDIKWS